MKQIAETLIVCVTERLDTLTLKNPVLSPTGTHIIATVNNSKSEISQLLKSGKDKKADTILS